MNVTDFNCTENFPPNDGNIYCPSNLDVFQTCWNFTRAGVEALSPCPSIFKSEGKVNAFAKRRCEINGTWFTDPKTNQPWIDFTTCAASEHNLVIVYFVGYSMSAVCLVASLIIFFFFKQLHCDRIILHKNLFACYLLNAMMWLLFYYVVSNVQTMEENTFFCQFIFLIATYFSFGTYFWMFSEGIYLAVILIVTFHHGSKLLVLCLIIGWGLPFILTFVYALTRYLLEKPNQCWMSKSNLSLMLTVPTIVALTANLIIILFILKIIITKLRHPSTREEAQWRKTAKAVFMLIPLFGLQNVIFIIKPGDSQAAVIHDYITGVTTSFQGVLVSFILCFFNGEVKNILQRRASQHRILKPLKTSRRGTYSTEINNFSLSPRPSCMRTVSLPSNTISKEL